MANHLRRITTWKVLEVGKIISSSQMCLVARNLCTENKLAFLKSNSPKYGGKRNEEFHNEKVQAILKRVTGMDLDKVFSPRLEKLSVPSYKLMTDDEVNQAKEEIKTKAEQYLEMPPVTEERKPIDITLSNDPQIAGHDKDNAKFVFTDISPGIPYRDRRIVVREPDGILREGTWSERDTLEIIYFPRRGLRMSIPAFLRDKQLPVVFQQKRHLDVLDFVCLQCQPDSPDYLRVHRRTYQDIDRHRLYYLLRSTRHFGGLVYHLVKNKQLNGLLAETLRDELLEDAIDLVRLYYILHADEQPLVSEDGIQLLREFLTSRSMEEALGLLADVTFDDVGLS